MDLLDGDGVEEGADHAPDAREEPVGVDEVHAAQALRVVVLAHARRLLDVAEDLARVAEADAVEVHDGARRLEQVARLARARGQPRVRHLLVLDGQVGQHVLILNAFVLHGAEIDLAKLLDIDRSSVL